MKNILRQLPSTEKMEFLEKKGLVDLAADMLFEEGEKRFLIFQLKILYLIIQDSLLP